MKLKFAFLFSLVIMLFFIGSVQVGSLFYFEDDKFTSQVERQLVSAVQIKGERINDYFLERKQDIEFISSSSEVNDLLAGEFGYSNIIEENMIRKLEIISGQIEIFMNKYPGMTLVELRADEDFRKIVSQNVGERSRTLLVTPESDIVVLDNLNGNVGRSFSSVSGGGRIGIKDTGMKSGDGASLGIAYIVYENEFKVIAEDSKFLERFSSMGEYEDLILINKDGFVVYDIGTGVEIGRGLNYISNSQGDLGKIYSLAKSLGGSAVYGPYVRESSEGFDLVLAFVSLAADGGMVVTFDSMDFINTLLGEQNGLGGSGEVYLLNSEELLISSLNENSEGELVQRISNENSEKCFEKKSSVGDFSEIISRSYGASGDEVIGTYAYIEETNWCLISEVNSREVFYLPKEGAIMNNVYFILFYNLGLLGFGFWFVRKYLK